MQVDPCCALLGRHAVKCGLFQATLETWRCWDAGEMLTLQRVLPVSPKMGAKAQGVIKPGAGTGGYACPAMCVQSRSSWDLRAWEAEMFQVPGCSRATPAEDADCCSEARHHHDGLRGRNDKHWLFPAAVREVN